jgi:hypothetical protein
MSNFFRQSISWAATDKLRFKYSEKCLPMFRRRVLPPSSMSSSPQILYLDSYNLNIQAAPSFDTPDTSKKKK